MKVNLYQVVSSEQGLRLEAALNAIRGSPIDQRLRTVSKQEMRVESILPPHSRGNQTDYWLIDFTKLRFEHGPGKASRTEPIQGFVLEQDEGFGEETAALFDPQSHHILVQYNHYGPRAGSVQEYLSTFTNDEARVFELQARLDERAEIRLAQKQVIKKLHYKIAPPRMTAAMRRAGVSVERSLELSDHVNGQTIEVVISAGRGQLSAGRIRQTIDALKRLVAPDALGEHGAIETLKIQAKTDLESPSEVIDLLTPKLELELDGLEMGEDRRYTQQSRWGVLVRARNAWAGLL